MPAFTTSSFTIGTQVAVFPLAMPEEASTQPAWQIVATTPPLAFTPRTTSSIGWLRRMPSGANPPGTMTASKSSMSMSAGVASAMIGYPSLLAYTTSVLGPTTTTSAPSSRNRRYGYQSSSS